MNIVRLRQNTYDTIHISVCLFCVLRVYLEFESRIYRDIRHISCEHTHLFSNFLKLGNLNFLDVVLTRV
jgi:hypothetical protein